MRDVNIDSSAPELHLDLVPTQEEMDRAINLFQSGQLAEAEERLINLTQTFPGHPFAWKGLSVIYYQTGRALEALTPMQQVTRLSPSDAESFSNLGGTYSDLGRHLEAEESLREAIRLAPDYAEAHFNLGNTLRALERFHEAEQSFVEAVRIKPLFVEAWCNLGVILRTLVRLNDSERSLREAIRLFPEYAEAHFNLGNTLRELGRLDESEHSFREAIRISPEFTEAFCNVGVTLRDKGQYHEAEASLRQAIRICPINAEAHSNLGVILNELGRMEEAERHLRESIRFRPEAFEFRSNLLYLLSSFKKDEASVYLEEARQFGQLVSKNVSGNLPQRPPESPPNKLKIGLVSGDFRKHPVGYFIEGLSKALDDRSIALFAFPTNLLHDDLTARLYPEFSGWHPIFGLQDAQAATLIQQLGIHILIDLSGHTEHNRLPVFAHKPAPIQASWLGYWASTGLSEIDYLLGDPIVTPESDDAHFVEKIWRLPETRFCYTPPEEEIEIAEPPFLQNGYVTFGCFNKLNKMTEQVVLAWSRILKEVPTAHLFLKAKQLDDESERKRVQAAFEAHDIPTTRLMLEGSSSRKDYLKTFNRIDIGLDPFPFTGGTTSADALWMGVPVLTLKGSNLISRQGEGIAANSHQTDWIALDEEEYVSKAVKFASDFDLLADKKRGLRQQISKSPLYDSTRFARNFENAMWAIWRQHLEAQDALSSGYTIADAPECHPHH